MSEPKWLEIARGEIGVKEVVGDGSNPRVEEYQRAAHGHEDDEIPWCSSFCCWAMEQAGIQSPRSGAARSWMKWGMPLKVPQPGAITVLWRGDPKSYKGHVGIYVGENPAKGEILLLGGNQSNSVKVHGFPKSRVLGYRWPLSLVS